MSSQVRPRVGSSAGATCGKSRGGIIGGLIGLAFGWLWLFVGSTAAGSAGTAILIGGSAVFVLAAWRTVTREQPGEGRFNAAYYIAAVVAEIVAIAASQSWLSSHQRGDLLFPVVGIIVGLHFIGLWLASRREAFLWLSGAMVAINLLALLLPLSEPARTILSGFGSSASLLVAVVA
jgi:hypothetical protein